MSFIPFSSVTIKYSEHEIFAGLRLLGHRSDTFFMTGKIRTTFDLRMSQN